MPPLNLGRLTLKPYNIVFLLHFTLRCTNTTITSKQIKDGKKKWHNSITIRTFNPEDGVLGEKTIGTLRIIIQTLRRTITKS